MLWKPDVENAKSSKMEALLRKMNRKYELNLKVANLVVSAPSGVLKLH
jgi:hypothetical protein